MAKTIHKFPLTHDTSIVMSPKSKVLSVQMQGGTPQMWVLLDPKDYVTHRRFVLIGTGHEVPANGEWVATFQQPPFVWHVFELTM